MFVKLMMGVLIVALLIYYLLLMLQIFGFIKMTDTDNEVSWIPFYYLFKKGNRTKNVKQPPSSTVEGGKKKTSAKNNRQGRKNKRNV
jgi:hypothetical protein